MRESLDLKPSRFCLLACIVLTMVSTAVSGVVGWTLLGLAALFVLASVVLYSRERKRKRQ
jgi:hypothetical protein